MTPADEVGKCPECGSIDRGTRYLITPPTEGNPLGTFCKNAWHHVPPVPPEVHQDDFTEQEFNFIFGTCLGLPNKEIAKHYGIAQDIVTTSMRSVFDKTGISNRAELILFVINTLNSELRRRSGGDSGAAMEG